MEEFRMKKFLAIMLVLAMALMMLAGCQISARCD